MLGRIKIIILFIIFLTMITTTGCWNNKDLADISFAVAVGLDKIQDDKIELTIQLVKPSAMKSGQNGGGGKEEKAVWSLSEEGDTVFEALRNMAGTANHKIFLSHVQIIVIGEELSREGIMDVLDFFERDHESNRRSDILVTKGITAKEILNAESELEKIPAAHLTKIMKNEKAIAKIKRIMLTDLLKEIGSPGKDPAIGVIETVRKKEKLLIEDMKVEGAAVFKKDKLVGWLTPIETRGLLFVEDKVQSGIINISNPLDRSKKVGIEIIRSTGKKDIKVKDGKFVCRIQIEEAGNIGEQQGTGDLTTQDMLEELEKQTEEAIRKEIEAVVKLAQNRYECDVFGFGEIVHRKYPDYWKQVKDNWREEFCNMPVEIEVISKIRRSGLITKTTKPV